MAKRYLKCPNESDEQNWHNLLISVAEVVVSDVHQLISRRFVQEPITRDLGAKLETREV